MQYKIDQFKISCSADFVLFPTNTHLYPQNDFSSNVTGGVFDFTDATLKNIESNNDADSLCPVWLGFRTE